MKGVSQGYFFTATALVHYLLGVGMICMDGILHCVYAVLLSVWVLY